MPVVPKSQRRVMEEQGVVSPHGGTVNADASAFGMPEAQSMSNLAETMQKASDLASKLEMQNFKNKQFAFTMDLKDKRQDLLNGIQDGRVKHDESPIKTLSDYAKQTSTDMLSPRMSKIIMNSPEIGAFFSESQVAFAHAQTVEFNRQNMELSKENGVRAANEQFANRQGNALEIYKASIDEQVNSGTMDRADGLQLKYTAQSHYDSELLKWNYLNKPFLLAQKLEKDPSFLPTVTGESRVVAVAQAKARVASGSTGAGGVGETGITDQMDALYFYAQEFSDQRYTVPEITQNLLEEGRITEEFKKVADVVFRSSDPNLMRQVLTNKPDTVAKNFNLKTNTVNSTHNRWKSVSTSPDGKAEANARQIFNAHTENLGHFGIVQNTDGEGFHATKDTTQVMANMRNDMVGITTTLSVIKQGTEKNIYGANQDSMLTKFNAYKVPYAKQLDKAEHIKNAGVRTAAQMIKASYTNPMVRTGLLRQDSAEYMDYLQDLGDIMLSVYQEGDLEWFKGGELSEADKTKMQTIVRSVTRRHTAIKHNVYLTDEFLGQYGAIVYDRFGNPTIFQPQGEAFDGADKEGTLF